MSSTIPQAPRRRRFIKPGLQIWLVCSFFGISLLGLTIQFLLFGFLMLRFANGVPSGGEYLIEALPRVLLMACGGSLLVLLPATALIGLAVTFRVAGPVHRFETYLAQVARGEDPGPCRIRQGDRLFELCDQINAALEAVRGSTAAAPAVVDDGDDPQASSAAA